MAVSVNALDEAFRLLERGYKEQMRKVFAD
jgi:hypothetical protein